MLIYKGDNYILEVLLLDNQNNRISGKEVYYKIYNSMNNSLIESGQLNDEGNGLYRSSYVFSDVGQYRIEYLLPEGWTDLVETIIVKENALNNDVMDILKRILGLVQENYILEPLQYNSYMQMTKGRIKIYNNATDCLNEENERDSYYIEAEYDSEGRLLKYKVIRE